METDPTRKHEVEGLRARTTSRVVVVAATIIALLAVLLLFEHRATQIPAAEGQDSFLAESPPRIGVSISTQPASQPENSEVLAAEISNAPDVAQVAIDSLTPPDLPAPISSATVSEESSGVAIPDTALSRAVIPKTGRTVSTVAIREEREKTLNSNFIKAEAGSVSSVSAVKQQGGFVLQLGVFSNMENVEDLRAKLKQAGIIVKLETRVQIGPFASKEDAVRVQARLRKLGLDDGMLISATKRP